MKETLLVLLVGLVVLVVAAADDIADSELNTFNPGDPALASEVNENFDAVQAAVNDNDARLDTVEAQSAGLITGVSAGTGLTGGGSTGDVTLSVAANGITGAHIAASAVTTGDIADGTITDADVSASAMVSVSKLDTVAAYAYDITNYTANDYDWVTVQSQSITLPAPGYVIAFGSCEGSWTNPSGTNLGTILGVAITNSPTGTGHNETYFKRLNPLDDGLNPNAILTNQKVFHFSSAGTTTIYLRARGGGTGDTAEFKHGNLILLYIPNL